MFGKELYHKFILCIIFVILLFCFMAAEINFARAEFEPVAENSYLKLYINHENAEIAVTDKNSGNTWYSNPPGRSDESIARGRTADRLRSQLRISYFAGQSRRYMNSYTDSVQNDQFNLEYLDNGVRIEFVMGEVWQEHDYVPLMISETSLEENILNKIDDDRDKSFVKDLYESVDLKERPENYEKVEIYGFDKEKAFGNYTITKKEDWTDRERRQFLIYFTSRLVELRENVDSRGGITFADIKPFKKNPGYILKDGLADWDLDDFAEILMEIGYTPDENTTQDHMTYGIAPPQPGIRIFEVPLEYYLDGKNLVAKVPVEEINYPDGDVAAGDPAGEERITHLPLVEIEIMEFFGAADQNEEGYMLVPDGSGALINLNNEKTNRPSYRQNLYGRDYSVREREEMRFANKQLHLPVFGLKQNDRAFLGVIEKGKSLASINADIAGRTTTFNKVFPSFNVLPHAQVTLTGELEESAMNIYQSRLPEEDLQIRYHFLSDDRADYVGMAEAYRDYLIGNGILEPLPAEDNLPFFLDLVGSIHHQAPVMGIPRRKVKPLTTYEQTKKIVEKLINNGIDNINLRYRGWLEGGQEHNFPVNLILEDSVGTENELNDLYRYLNEKGVKFYPEIDFQFVYNNQLFNGFSTRRDGTRFISGETAFMSDYHLANYRQLEEEIRYILSPRHLNSTRSDFSNEYHQIEPTNLTLKNMGEVLFSDFRSKEEDLIDRIQAKRANMDFSYELQNKGVELLLTGGNSYMLGFSNKLMETPLRSTGQDIIDRGIPFFPIVLHGYYHFSGQPINLVDNMEDYFLKMLETGAAPNFRLMYESSSALKNTPFDDNFNLHYGKWLKEAEKKYREMNEILGPVHHKPITDHKKLKQNIVMTEYGEKKSVVINYRNTTVNLGSFEIPAKGYKILEGRIKEVE